MIRALHSVLISYIRLARSAQGTPEALAWESLETFTTFRLSDGVDSQRSIGFRVLWRTMREMLAGGSYVKTYASDSRILVLDGDFSSDDIRMEYVHHQLGEKPDLFVSKAHTASGFKKKPLAQFYYLLIGTVLSLRCFFQKKNRTNRALQIRLLAENAALLHFIRNYRPETIYHFANCLIDNNWIYLLTNSYTKGYYRVLSPYAMTTHNKFTLTDTLVTCLPYHRDELKVLPGVHYNHQDQWVPELAFEFMPRYLNPDLTKPEPGTIGYYSHGSWVRHALGNRSDSMGIDYAEENVLTFLGRYLETHKDVKLSIFLHPKEKKEPWFSKAREYYGKFFASDSYDFVDISKSGSSCFELVDVGVAVFTSIMYERLFAGYKTLIGVTGLNGYPVADSSLDGIVFHDYDVLQNHLDRSINLSQKEFFAEFEVEAYHHSAYPSFDKFKSIIDEPK